MVEYFRMKFASLTTKSPVRFAVFSSPARRSAIERVSVETVGGPGANDAAETPLISKSNRSTTGLLLRRGLCLVGPVVVEVLLLVEG